MLNRLWLTVERCIVFNMVRLLRIRRQSEKVARGFSIGLVVNFFPTFGFGVLISGFLARLLGGNFIAGLVGGTTLSFLWPVLFYLNVRMGSLFVQPAIMVDDLDDITEKTMRALMWGKAFTAGAVVNSLLVGLLVYMAFRLVYHELRPVALAYFRRHAREHQKRFRLPKNRRIATPRES